MLICIGFLFVPNRNKILVAVLLASYITDVNTLTLNSFTDCERVHSMDAQTTAHCYTSLSYPGT